ncbi:MAG: DNA-binding transcriptional MerR regulator [Candidatus Latescibacterota bacterium]
MTNVSFITYMSKELSAINQQELEYLLNAGYLEDFPGLQNSMNIPQFTIKDLGVTPRDATYWSKKEILPEITGANTTRRKYTLKQALWIKLIQQLRTFDISLKQIKKIKDNLLKPDSNFKNIMEDDQVKLVIEHLAEKDGQLEEYKQALKDPAFLRKMENIQFDPFENMVLYAILFRRDVSFIVTVKGESFPYVFDKHEVIKKEVPGFEKMMKSPHIVLSLTQAYSQLIQEWREKKWFDDVSIVSKDEKKILGLLREKSTKELKIMKNGSEVDRVILVADKSINAFEEFANHIVRNGYQTMTISTREGKPVHFKNEVSIKLKNIPEEPEN